MPPEADAVPDEGGAEGRAADIEEEADDGPGEVVGESPDAGLGKDGEEDSEAAQESETVRWHTGGMPEEKWVLDRRNGMIRSAAMHEIISDEEGENAVEADEE